MAEKHKSKYKKPENTKYKSRKDLKDYTEDDKQGTMNPKSTGEKQSNVLRKTDKEFVDTGDMYVKYNADDRLYKDLEDGEYDPKHAAKVLKKRQDKDEKDNAKNIKDKIENLTREGKERLVREYIRRKINILTEQPAPAEEAPAEETPAEDPLATDPAAMPDAAAPAPDATAPAPDATAEPAAPTPAAPAAAPAPATQPIDQVAGDLAKEGNVGKIKMLNNLFNSTFKETDPEDKASFYKMLRSFAIKKISKMESEVKTSEE
jgi:hypothetical protein